MPVVGGNKKDSTLVRVVTSRVSILGSCRRLGCKVQKLLALRNGIEHYGINKRI